MLSLFLRCVDKISFGACTNLTLGQETRLLHTGILVTGFSKHTRKHHPLCISRKLLITGKLHACKRTDYPHVLELPPRSPDLTPLRTFKNKVFSGPYSVDGLCSTWSGYFAHWPGYGQIYSSGHALLLLAVCPKGRMACWMRGWVM